MATLEDLRKHLPHFTAMSWEEQLAHIKGIRAKRREKSVPKAHLKRLNKAIASLSQAEIEGLRKVLQEARAREAAQPTQLSLHEESGQHREHV